MVPGPGEDEGGNRGGARVRMRDFATAREAAKVSVGSWGICTAFLRNMTCHKTPYVPCISILRCVSIQIDYQVGPSH